ncbi:MAG: hypothetical protein IPG04_16700 [Polyangiaceae bacterium]|nr:hypothetical protein [Polyangiaceae bacterium]
MRNAGLVIVVLLLVVTGCFDSVRSRRGTTPPEAPATSTAKGAAEARDGGPATPREDPKQRRKELEKRLKAAIELDGHPQGWEMTEAVAGCKGGGLKCTSMITKVQNISEACFLGGQVLFFLRDGDLDEAESRLERVEASAEKMGPIRKQAAAQQKAVTDAATVCEKDRAPCRTRCDKENDLPACIAYGVALYVEDKKYDDARTYLKKGCDGKYELACNLAKDVDKVEAEEKKSATAKVDAAWSALTAVGDDLATKKFLHRVASQNFKGAKNAAATQRMGLHIQEMTKDYCEAAKEFSKVSTKAELAKRAKKHCDEDPPTATGLGGTEETLTVECKAVYATPCS